LRGTWELDETYLESFFMVDTPLLRSQKARFSEIYGTEMKIPFLYFNNFSAKCFPERLFYKRYELCGDWKM
jgi:hypothetical protein